MIIETQRLALREMTGRDIPALKAILQDKTVMYAYEHAFSDEEVRSWYETQQSRYKKYGFGLWGVFLKEQDGFMIGQCGLTYQSIPQGEVLEVGYLLNKTYWGRGYASEAARACRDYAFKVLGAKEVFSVIREGNTASMNVAIRNGMTLKGSFIKHYYGIEMPHYVFSTNGSEILT